MKTASETSRIGSPAKVDDGAEAGNQPNPGTASIAAPPPRWVLFATLSLLWIFPSAGAIYILGWTGGERFVGSDWSGWLGSIRLEDWIASGLLLVHCGFVGATVRGWCLQHQGSQGRTGK